MSRWTPGRAAAIAALLLAPASGPAASQLAPPLWGDLEPGPYGVGFRSEWLLDHGRSYRAEFDDGSSYGEGKAARPLLVNVWYPAVSDSSLPRMRHVEYLDIASSEPDLASFAGALRRYNIEVVSGEVTGVAPDEQDAGMAARFEASLAVPTASVRAAPAADGRFPVVIYHAGHGSSFDDNAVLCEVLASYGYIVIGSAFQRGDGSALATDTRAASIADIDALIRYARELERADWRRIGLAGHSGGAQIALQYAVRPGSAIDAYVLLDTTQDYYGFSVRFWPYTDAVLESREYLTAPVLLAAAPHGVFMVADSLASADRYYLTLLGVEHAEFISQGLMAADFEGRAATAAARSGAGPDDVYHGDPAVMERYEMLVTNVRRFLDGHLRGDTSALRTLRSDLGATPLGGAAPHVDYVPEGTTSAPPYTDSAPAPPSPRQIRPLMDRVGVERTIGILRRWNDGSTPSPVHDERVFAVALLYDLVSVGRTDDAGRLYRFFAGVHDNLIGDFLRWYDVFSTMDDRITAQEWLDVAIALDPTHPAVLERSRRSPGA